MKLSKRFAAALIALCMLLTVMPASAEIISSSDGSTTVDSGWFPAGTIFISANRMDANGAPLASQSDWTSANYDGYNSFSGTDAPSGTYVAQATDEYVVYALKSQHSESQDRWVKVQINGTEFTFKNERAIKNNTKGWYWEKGENQPTLKLVEGGLIAVNLKCASYTFARSAGFALVPASKVPALESNANWYDFSKSNTGTFNGDQFGTLHDLTTVKYVKPDEVFANIKVNGEVVENVGSDEAEDVLAVVASTDFDGAVINDVTIMDALVAAGKITADNATTYKNKLVVKLNGLTICDSYDKWIVTETDEIVVEEPTTIDKTNFAPVNFGAIKETLGGDTGGVKMVFNKAATKGTQLKFIFDSSDAYIDDVLKGAKLRGFGKYDAEAKDATGTNHGITFPAGTKFYFDKSTFDATLKPAEFSHGIKLTGIQQSGSTDYAVFYVTLPDGSYAHHPYLMTPNGIKDMGNFDGVWAVNSETTDKVQARFVNGKFQLYTDGSRALTIVRIKNGNITMEDAYVSVGEPVHLKLDAGEKAYVWARNHFVSVETAGTTMKPLTEVLENPAE